MLQERLISHYWSVKSDKDLRLPVIVDISETIPSLPGHPTDIEALKSLINALRELSPAAIGIDIDFSPDRGLIRPTDWNTFSQWSRLTRPDDSRPLPVKLGVFRRLYDVPKNWLGRSEFRSLAAGMAVPEDHQNNYYYVQARENENERLLQLAAALYEASDGKRPPSGGVLPKLLTETAANHRYGVYVVDYSYLQEINDHQVIRYVNPQLLRAYQDQIRDNVVFVGDVGRGEDKFALAHTTEQISGVLIHACSLMTLRNGPLRYIDSRRSIALDVTLTFSSLFLVIFLPFVIQPRNPDFHAAETRLCWIVAFLVFLLCYGWIGWAGIFWPDFLWISIGLLIYPLFAEPVWRLLNRNYETICSFFRWIFKGEYGHAH